MRTNTRMKLTALAAAVGLVVSSGVAGGELTTATQTVNYEVPAINLISVSGPATLTIVAPEAGQEIATADDKTTTWDITTNNQTTMKLTAQIPLPLGAGLVLTLGAEGPTGSTGTIGSPKTLSTGTDATTPQDVVTNISAITEGGLSLEYYLSATAGAAPVDTSQSVTFTLVGS
jgi:hypothetical protein